MIRKIARPMLASAYIVEGAGTFIDHEAHVESTEAFLNRVRSVLPRKYAKKVPKDSSLVSSALGGAKMGAGCMLVLGKMPRTSAAVLAATTIPTLFGEYAFWETQDEAEQRALRTNFLSHLALLGGAIIAAADTSGKPGISWRVSHAADQLGNRVQEALPTKSETEEFTDSLGSWLTDATTTARDYVTEAVDYVDENADSWLEQAKADAKVARKAAVRAATKAQDKAAAAFDEAAAATGKAATRSEKKAKKLQKKADKALAKAQKKLKDFAF